PPVRPDSLTLGSLTAAEAFVDAYYAALKTDRSTISTFYCPKQTDAEGITVPSIAWNGTLYNDATTFQKLFEDDLTYTHFEVELLDCNILNTKYMLPEKLKGGCGDNEKDLDRRMSFAVAATGSVRLKEALKGPLREFSESFVLVPNPEQEIGTLDEKGKRKLFVKGAPKEWLIQSQNFRFTEWDEGEAREESKVDGAAKQGGKAGNNGPKRNAFGHLAAAGLLGKGKAKA
ncbi:hypothetical protein K469DRAFT_599013, partial [Zopfia rhizophila CBS 207.26]